jgi:cyclic pyranopterin phosphate synthase
MAERLRLSHVDTRGTARMVSVSAKPDTLRAAEAEGRVILSEKAFRLVRLNRVAKGDVLSVARIAGIQAAKRTGEWIPLCHPILLTSVQVDLALDRSRRCVMITSRAEAHGPTGVEMEALTAVTAAALTVYDMCKAVDRSIRVEGIRLNWKRGGRSGEYRRV